MSFERIDSDEQWRGKIASVYVDRFRYDDGAEKDREVIRHPGAVVVVAHDGEALYLITQPREAVGFEPAYVTTGGGSDANAFIAGGFPCVNLANGTERNHQPDERVSTWALEEMLDVALNLVKASAA